MSIHSMQAAAPLTSAATISSSAAPRVSTVRLWAPSEWRSSSAAPVRTRPRSRRSCRGHGQPRSSGPRAPPGTAQPPTSSSPARTSGSPSTLTSGFITTQSRWTGTWTVPPIAAEAPNATWQVPRIFSSSSRLPVRIARLVRADPELGDVGAVLAVRGQQLHQPLAVGAARRRPGGRPRPSARPARRRGRSPRSSRRPPACPRAVPSIGAMKPSPQGRLPKAPGALRSPASGIPSRSPEAEPQVGPVRVGDPRLSARGQQLGDRLALAAQALDVGRHHPREHLLGRRRAASRSAPRASVASRRASVCESDCMVGQRTTSAAAIAAATRGGRLGAVRARARPISARTPSAPGATGLAAQALAEPDRRRVGDHQDLLALPDPQAVADDRA